VSPHLAAQAVEAHAPSYGSGQRGGAPRRYKDLCYSEGGEFSAKLPCVLFERRTNEGAVDLFLPDDYCCSGDADDLHVGAGRNQALAQFERAWCFADDENIGAGKMHGGYPGCAKRSRLP